MKRLIFFIMILLLVVSSCRQNKQTKESITLLEGDYCLPYTPQGQSIYDAKWTGEIPIIEEMGTTYKTATFGMGCFWGPAAEFVMVDGVIRTRVGYTGGASTTPSYDNLGNHIEVIEVDYNPSVISYSQLIEVYFDQYNATERPFSQRVKSVIFYRTEEENMIANKIKKQVTLQLNQGIFTEIDPVTTFYLAENKHQLSYLKKETSLYSEVTQIFPDEKVQLLSVLASKLNGIVAGFGTEEQVLRVLKESGLSEASKNRVKEIVITSNRE